MSLTIAEKYVAENTLCLYNQILDIGFYSLIWKGENIMVGWDMNNERIVNIFGRVDYKISDVRDLEEIIFKYITDNGLTSDNQ
jgi:hypothetical protein